MTDVTEVTPERFPLHFAVTKVFGGEVLWHYSSRLANILGPGISGRYFLRCDDGVTGCWTDQTTGRFSTAFHDMVEGGRGGWDLVNAVAAFRDLVENGGSDHPPWPIEAEDEEEDAPGLIIDADGTLSLRMSLASYVSGDDVDLPREQFLARVADRINDDLCNTDGGGIGTAFQTVLDLARQNIIDPRDDPEEAARQDAACDSVEAFAARELGGVFVLLWVDTLDVTVEVHATEKSAVDSADKLRRNVPKRASRKFKTADSVNHYMERHGIIGGIYRRSIAV